MSMLGFLPGRKPSIDKKKAEFIGEQLKIDRDKYPCFLIGLKGYYLSMGEPYENDRRIYDDAFCFVSPGVHATFNGNVDPNGYRYGYGKGAKKGMASLKLGTWFYRKGLHRGYPAFIQADKVTVIRDGKNGDYEDTGWFGINIHRGGSSSTSSLGCQTVPPIQWPTFKELIYAELDRYGQSKFPYLLLDAKNFITEDESKGTRDTLRSGDKGNLVRVLQNVLRDLDFEILPKVVIDGDFGPVTERHVKQLQDGSGLVVDGIVGSKTWEIIDSLYIGRHK